MKDWVTPFKETAAHVKATAALLWEMLLQGLQDWDALIVWLALNLGLGFYLRQIIFIDFHATSERTIQKYFTWAEDKRYGLGTRSTCWLSPGTVQKMLKQRLTVVQFFFSADFLTPAQCTELTGGPSPATGPILLSLTVKWLFHWLQMYGGVWKVIMENILSRAGNSSPPSENKQHARNMEGYFLKIS